MLEPFPNRQEDNAVELHYGNSISSFRVPFPTRVVFLLLHELLPPRGYLTICKYAKTKHMTYLNKLCILYLLINYQVKFSHKMLLPNLINLHDRRKTYVRSSKMGFERTKLGKLNWKNNMEVPLCYKSLC